MATKSSSLRDNIFALLQDGSTSVDEDLEALSQCAAQVRNRRIVGGIAQESGVTLVGFLTNDALEVYYDIKRGRHDLGYISKGWEDPGFRIGDLVNIGWWDTDLVKTNTPELLRFCATRGIAMTIQEAPLITTFQLDGVIYSEGFNRETFLQTLDSLNACVGKIESLIPGHHQGRPPLCFGTVSTRMAKTTGRSH